MPDTAIVTVGDELLCGDVANTNANWLARELEKLGVRVRMIATLPDDRAEIASFVRWARGVHDSVVVTGGLGGTPDDVTRGAVADAFGVATRLDYKLARELEATGGHAAVFAAAWCRLPEGSRLLGGASGGAPAFAVENVYALAGVPAEMRATFRAMRNELRVGPARETWRKMYPTTEDQISLVLDEVDRNHRGVAVGSYPSFGRRGPRVEVVLRAWGADALAAAASEIETALSARGITPST